MSKECTFCNKIKSIDLFTKSKATKSGYAAHCRECASYRSKVYRNKNKNKYSDYFKKYYKRNVQYFKDFNLDYRNKNK